MFSPFDILLVLWHVVLYIYVWFRFFNVDIFLCRIWQVLVKVDENWRKIQTSLELLIYVWLMGNWLNTFLMLWCVELCEILHMMKPHTGTVPCFILTHGYGALVLRVFIIYAEFLRLKVQSTENHWFVVGSISLYWLGLHPYKLSHGCTN